VLGVFWWAHRFFSSSQRIRTLHSGRAPRSCLLNRLLLVAWNLGHPPSFYSGGVRGDLENDGGSACHLHNLSPPRISSTLSSLACWSDAGAAWNARRRRRRRRRCVLFTMGAGQMLPAPLASCQATGGLGIRLASAVRRRCYAFSAPASQMARGGGLPLGL